MAGRSLAGRLGVAEVKDNKSGLGKALIAEALGLFFINYFGCLSCTTGNSVIISLAFGFVVFILVQTLGHVSGGHFNPAITAALVVTNKVTLIRGLLYIAVQCLGAIAGSAVLKVLLPTETTSATLGLTNLKNVTVAQAVGLEFFLGFILVLVVFGVTDPHKGLVKIVAPLTIGIAVAVGHLTTLDYTGSSMNPARSFGVSVVTGVWEHHWIYWVGPSAGGLVAALVYEYLLAAPQVGDYTPVNIEEKELKRLDGKNDDGLP